MNFTQRAAAEEVQNLMSVDLSSKAEKEALKEALRGERFASPYGKELQRFLRHGLGLHHAGLLPRYRRLVRAAGAEGPAEGGQRHRHPGRGGEHPHPHRAVHPAVQVRRRRRTCILSVREFQQIAGRAGRKGFDERGWVVAQAPAYVIENKKPGGQGGRPGKKVHKQKPPDKGYVHFDKGTFDRLAGGVPEPLESRFAVSHGLLLSLLQGEQGDPRPGRRLPAAARAHRRLPRRAAGASAAASAPPPQAFRTLRRAGLVELRRDERARNPYPAPHPSLQQRLLACTTRCRCTWSRRWTSWTRRSRRYPLDVLSLVESILENPRPVLHGPAVARQGRAGRRS